MEDGTQETDKSKVENSSVEQDTSEQSLEEMSAEALEQLENVTRKEYDLNPSEELQKKLSEISIVINDKKIAEAILEEPEKQPAVEQQAPEQPAVEQQAPEQPAPEEPKEEMTSHLFALRTTGGQEKVVLNLLQNRVKSQNINIQSVLLVDNLKGYVVLEAVDVNQAFNAIQGIRHIRGQLRGELEFKDIEGYLIKKSTVSELAVDKIVEIIGGPFKGMKATITRVDHEKEEATVILLDAPYQLPVTVDANYLKLINT
ncbi:MAG: transcription elongation factor Spt5 [Thaumarchaeota archaeon]|nr:transcription elongation factor Spt5 [Nitrososphaerota archaeon]